jgi:sulfoxide reductase heme-binding subunit YedZ
MSVAYRPVQWNPFKVRYDLVLGGAIVLFLGAFVAAGKVAWRGEHAVADPILLMRAFGTCAIVLLHVVLCIGPLARLDRRFLPLLYNRRHLGVATFSVAFVHALLAVAFYHGFGTISPLESLLTSNTQYRSVSGFPFEILGAFGLLIMFLMAATSHDFWLKNLTPAVWKWLHMAIYPAWAALVLHVALGALQSERSVLYPMLLGLGVVTVASLHLVAGWREAARDAARVATRPDGRLDVGPVGDLSARRGRVVCMRGRERAAVFLHGDGNVSAIGNVCAHQGGPLGEGKVIGGCVTCPWHGYQYRPADGQSPPPFSEKVPTHRVAVIDGRAAIDPSPLPPGTPVEPATIAAAAAEVTHA